MKKFLEEEGVEEEEDSKQVDSIDKKSGKTKSWKDKPQIVGRDFDAWKKEIFAALDEGKTAAPEFIFVLQALACVGATKADLVVMAKLLSNLSSSELTDFDKVLIKVADVIMDSGIRFSLDDIFGDISLPPNKEEKITALLESDKALRKEAGDFLNNVHGTDVSNLGQPTTRDTTNVIFQHWGVLGHKAQECPHDKIDGSACNKELQIVTPKCIVSEQKGSKYNKNTELPPNFRSATLLRDTYPFLVDKEVRKPVPPGSKRKTKTPTDVRGQAQCFAKNANTTVRKLCLLPKLLCVLPALVAKLSGKHLQLIIFSTTAYQEHFDCAPPMTNALVKSYGAVVHAEMILCAKVRLVKRSDEELLYLGNKIHGFYADPLGLPPVSESKMLLQRSGRHKLSPEQKELLISNCPLKEWLENSTAEQRSNRAKKIAKTLGKEGCSNRSKKAMKTMGEEGLSNRSKKIHENRGHNIGIDLTGVPYKNPIPNTRRNGKRYKGACYDKRANIWRARITIDGKQKHIGSFRLEEEAGVAFAKAFFLKKQHPNWLDKLLHSD